MAKIGERSEQNSQLYFVLLEVLVSCILFLCLESLILFAVNRNDPTLVNNDIDNAKPASISTLGTIDIKLNKPNALKKWIYKYNHLLLL